jgi:RNA polymerase sigma-70 factor, ECF subfamily
MSQTLRAVPGTQAEAAPAASASEPPDLEATYARSASYVWRMLQRLGVRHADLEDVCHDVFLIAHRKFSDFDGRGAVNAWLFGICLRVAANYRKRAQFRLEHDSAVLDDDGPSMRAPGSDEPDQQLARRQAQARAQAILEGMDPSKRAVFVMFEVEGLSCHAIADELGIPIGTVYSRLHSARRLFGVEAQRLASSPGKKGP